MVDFFDYRRKLLDKNLGKLWRPPLLGKYSKCVQWAKKSFKVAHSKPLEGGWSFGWLVEWLSKHEMLARNHFRQLTLHNRWTVKTISLPDDFLFWAKKLLLKSSEDIYRISKVCNKYYNRILISELVCYRFKTLILTSCGLKKQNI